MEGQSHTLTSDPGDILSERRSSCQGAKQKQNVNGGIHSWIWNFDLKRNPNYFPHLFRI